MKYVIETKITDDGWTQEMVCTFQKEAIATLVLQDTEAQTWRRKAWDDNAPAATVKQKGNVVIVSCQHRRNWHNDYTVNKTCLELLAENWKDQADKWNRIHRYMAAALNPILTKMESDTQEKLLQLDGNITQLETLTTKQSSSIFSEVLDIKEALDEVEETLRDALDCIGSDFLAIEDIKKQLYKHTGKRFAHFSTRKERGGW